MVVATITAGLVKFWEVWFGLVWLHMVLMITLAISNGFKKLKRISAQYGCGYHY